VNWIHLAEYRTLMKLTDFFPLRIASMCVLNIPLCVAALTQHNILSSMYLISSLCILIYEGRKSCSECCEQRPRWLRSYLVAKNKRLCSLKCITTPYAGHVGCSPHYHTTENTFLDAFAKLRKATISFVMSVCPSSLSNSAPTRRIFMKFDIWVFFERLLRKFKFH
jgi:hypothetical protein